MALDRSLESHFQTDPLTLTHKPTGAVADFEAKIGHVFRDRDLLNKALTHVSAAADADRLESYQRLEFLGDRVLGLAVAAMLYDAFPKAQEGELSRRLADLVRRETCAEVAREWGVGAFLRLGTGEAQTGGRRKIAILADVCESLIGAVFVEAGFQVAREVIEGAWRERMLRPNKPLRDAKTALQEWAQAKGLAAPTYSEVSRSGPHHAPEFIVQVNVAGFAPLLAGGRSKRAAEQTAAEAFLVREGAADELEDRES